VPNSIESQLILQLETEQVPLVAASAQPFVKAGGDRVQQAEDISFYRGLAHAVTARQDRDPMAPSLELARDITTTELVASDEVGGVKVGDDQDPHGQGSPAGLTSPYP
jgi:hypothetical protein